MNDFLINTSIPVILYSNMLTFRDISKSFELDGDLLKTKTDCNYNVTHSNPQDPKLTQEIGEERKFDIKKNGQKIQGTYPFYRYVNHLLS